MLQTTSVMASMLASLSRASLKTLSWQVPWDTMMTAAQDALPMTRFLPGKEQPWPTHWKSHAFAANLRWAATAVVIPTNNTIQKRAHFQHNALAVAKTAIQVARTNEDPKIQRAAYNAIISSFQDPPIQHFIAKRWNELNQPIPSVKPQDVDNMLKSLRKMPPKWCSAVFKTTIGAWTTTHRMHDQNLRKCVLGCPDNDEYIHYMQCPRLHGLASAHINNAPIKPMHNQPAKWDQPWFTQLYVYFIIYHTISSRHKDLWPTPGNCENAMRNAQHLAEAFLREIM